MAKPQRPDDVLSKQLAATRKGRWTQEQLTKRLNDLGAQWDRTVVAKIESRARRRVDINELFLLAAGLGISPIHLIVPFDDEEKVEITPKIALFADEARAWIRGQQPLREEDQQSYWTITPERERRAFGDPRFRALYQLVAASIFMGLPLRDLPALLARLDADDPIRAVLEELDILEASYDGRIRELERQNVELDREKVKLEAEIRKLRKKRGGKRKR
jgi:transcriptional regulator with XRE-family HTH domain